MIGLGEAKYLVKTIRENKFIYFHCGYSMTKLLITLFLKEEMSSRFMSVSINRINFRLF